MTELTEYRNALSDEQRHEIVQLYLQGVLIKKGKTHYGFDQLVYEENQNIVAASMCPLCSQVFSIGSTVRSSLQKHMNQASHSGNGENIVVPSYVRLELARAIAEMVATDKVPFSITENTGFRNVLELVFKEGFTSGVFASQSKADLSNPPSIASSIPSRKVVKTCMFNYVNNMLPKFKQEIREHFENFGGCFTLDFGTKGTNYFAITCHYFTSSWEKRSYILKFQEYNEVNAQAANVLKSFMETMSEFGLSEEIIKKQVIFVTDRGSNLISAFRNFTRIDDTCHQLSILSKRTVDPYKKNYLPERFEINQITRKLIGEVAKILKNATKIIKAVNARPATVKKELKSKGIILVQYGETRWMSRFKSLKSLQKLDRYQKEYLQEELNDGYSTELKSVFDNMHIIEEYVDLMEPVDEAVTLLQSETKPTVNEVILQYEKIYLHFKSTADAQLGAHITAMANSAMKVLEYQKSIPTTYSDLHLVGLLLDALQKNKIAEVAYFYPGEIMKTFKEFVKSANDGGAIEEDEDMPEARPISPFSQHRLLKGANITDLESENYLDTDSMQLSEQYQNAIDFWKKNDSKYPKVAVLARKVLAITSSAASERAFSLLGNIYTKKRSPLESKTVENVILMNTLLKFEQDNKDNA